MQLKQAAIAGTLESSDAQVKLEPLEAGLEIEIHSTVMAQYGRQIRATVTEAMERLGIDNARVTVVDKGALACTLKARLNCAAYRAAGIDSGYPWGGAIR
ncbi:MAG: citrate lyase acyl carrier protein [Clostridiales bacterium]|nr:citrate lyase acyl carrier protein [Clostridiales bacterium]